VTFYAIESWWYVVFHLLRLWQNIIMVFYIKINVLTYWSSSPSTEKIRWFQLALSSPLIWCYEHCRCMWRRVVNMKYKFYIFRTVHLRIILVGKHFEAKCLLWCVYLNPLHVSSKSVLILRRTIVLIQLLV